MSHIFIAIFFFIIALLYSMVGFGGGSSYLAILALSDLPVAHIKLNALLCNIVVVGSAVPFYLKHKLYKFDRILPIIIVSIPLAFLGGMTVVADWLYFAILACMLIVAGLLIMIDFKSIEITSNSYWKHQWSTIAIGGIVGYLSGLIGIGGGIFLSPILYLLRWDHPKVIAATASFYILVNSIAGLTGQSIAANQVFNSFTISLICAVFVGGVIGTNISLLKLDSSRVKLVTGIMIVAVGVHLLISKVL